MSQPVAVPDRAPTRGRALRKGTLSRQLVTSTTALVALVTIALSLFTALASFQILQSQLDDRLVNALASRPQRGDWHRDDDFNPVDPGGSGLIRLDEFAGQWVATSSSRLNGLVT